MAGFYRSFPIQGDLALTDDGTDLVVIRGAGMALQQIRDGVEVWRGTAGWDPEKGLPMLTDILIKGPDFRVLRKIFRDFLLETAGVVSVEKVDVNLNRTTRHLTVNFSATCEDGATAADELAFTVI